MLTLTGHTKDVRAVVFAPDGRLVSGGGDKKVLIWDSAGTILETIKPRCIVYAVAVSPDGKMLACGGRPGDFVYLWDLAANQPAGQYNWPETVLNPPAAYSHAMTLRGSIWSLSFSSNGELLAGASRISGSGGDLDGFRARCWPKARPNVDDQEIGEANTYAVAFGPNGAALALTRAGNVALFDQPNGKELLTYKIQSTWAAAVAFARTEPTLIIAASSYLHFVDIKGVAKPQRVKTGFRTIASIAVSPDGRLLLVGGRPETLEIYDLRSRALRTKLDFELGAVHAVAFAPDNCTFAVGGAKGLMVCDVP